ncbi:MAG: DNA-3-methyladenine glycosylase 2 family protein, partial [Verrucomicrobia bacterium]|nr:DNA-3-methyladenine glycosylase 2 family protein [Verrucomicrobiota bacterium]
MLLNDEQRFKAIATRDRRFDGLFFVGVKSTGVYCRPGCPSKLPLRDNCVFFNHPAIAEAQGFRPCLRCRPELAPGRPLEDAHDDILRSAFMHIQAGALNDLNVASFAARFSLSERHFRRLITSRLGVSPVQLAQTQRLLLAKQLLTETNIPIIEVAFSAGFSSLRRFNDLFKKRYRLTPSALRKEVQNNFPVHANDRFVCRLAYRPPFDWESLLEFFKSRQFLGVESVGSGAYARTVKIGKASGWIVVRNRKERSEVVVEFSSTLLSALS